MRANTRASRGADHRHLEDHLDAATIEGSEVPADLPEPVEWRFDEPQPGWKPAYGYEFSQVLGLDAQN